ncbi:hypothetical protein BRC70_09425 [Halobacteriales archaeon QH_6_68_27]|jgi:hypothetical protein|nr:MAG: hypothetical protein BRC70_09425 [Halobacteriales archaeon QH_6_68_27]
MLDVPVESTYVWFGLAVVSAVLLGTVLRVPTAPPPDAAATARTVDSVASSPYEARARQPLDAAAIRLGEKRVGLRTDGGEAHAAFAYGAVVPTFGSEQLSAVLRGRPPDAVFETSDAFAAALERARTVDPAWQPAPDVLLVRRVTWGEVNATLVGA